MGALRLILFASIAVGAGAGTAGSPPIARARLDTFFEAISPDEAAAQAALGELERSWREGDAALLLELARFLRSPSSAARTGDESPDLRDLTDTGGGRSHSTPGGAAAVIGGGAPARPVERDGGPAAAIRRRLVRFLEKRTGQRHGDDLRAWRRWLWSRPYDPHPEYAAFKSALYGQIDPQMAGFFTRELRARIRLDEIDWGGVKVNGIPPLDHPSHVPASDAGYLKGGDVVFGVAAGGEARAYPRRIVGWHELVRDRLGAMELTLVYCTLCGTVIPYRSEVGGVPRTFGTSGLLYRSNKLLFDEQTRTLWSTLDGRPAVGPLVGSGLELTALPVVTTTWREWRAAHPTTTVLSSKTGFARDYAEGAAYRQYFATDRIMFEVPARDERLRNKDEVLAVLLRPKDGAADTPRRALALSAKFLAKNPVHSLSFAGHELVVVTTVDGANRVYDSGGTTFQRRLPDGGVADAAGAPWRVTEEALVSDDGRTLPRVPAWRAFWFAWFAQFPETELVR